jgi:hypothetical protein
MVEDGVAPSIFGLIERGIAREPELAAQMRGRVVFRFAEDFASASPRTSHPSESPSSRAAWWSRMVTLVCPTW